MSDEEADLSSRAHNLLVYLQENVDDIAYFRASDIAEDLESSHQDVGGTMRELEEAELSAFDVRIWRDASAGPVWAVERTEPDGAGEPVPVTDGGVIEYECRSCGQGVGCDVDGDGVRRCRNCDRAVTPVVTDGGSRGPDFEFFSTFRLLILANIAELEAGDEPSYGLGIQAALEDDLGTEVNHGRLYPNLDELRDRGYIEKAKLDERTNEYTLTARGADVLREVGELFTHAAELADPGHPPPAVADGGGHDG